MSLAATRELAETLGVDELELLRANRDRPWAWESGCLTFASLRPGDVLRLPDGREAQIMLMGGGLADFQSLIGDPDFAAAWDGIEAQLQSEGASDLDILSAKDALGSAFTGLTGIGGIFEGDAASALKSATSLVLAGNTISGAVQHVEGLAAAAQGADPTQAFQMFTGTLIGIATSAGALTAGVGAAIVAGVGVALEFLQSAGLFGSPPKGTEICSGLYFDPAPSLQVGCVAMLGATDAYGGKIKAGSPYWRRFPKPSGGNANDVHWFDGSAGFEWSGSPSGPLYTWGSYPGRRMIDMAFPDWHYLSCQSVIGGLADFQSAFTQAWIANKEYELNGLKSQADSAVLDNLVRVWNRAHDGSSYLDVSPASKPYVEAPSRPPVGTSGWGYTPPSLTGWGGCPANLPPLFQTVIGDLIANATASTPIVGNALRIHTGPKITPPKHLSFHLGAPAPKAPTPSGVGAMPATSVTPGMYVMVTEAPAGLSSAEFAAFLSVEDRWQNVSILWWGPSSSRSDPQNYLGLAQIAPSVTGGAVVALVTWTGAPFPVPSGVTLYPVTPAGTSTGTKVAIGGAVAVASAAGLWVVLGKPLTIQAAQAALGALLRR